MLIFTCGDITDKKEIKTSNTYIRYIELYLINSHLKNDISSWDPYLERSFRVNVINNVVHQQTYVVAILIVLLM